MQSSKIDRIKDLVEQLNAASESYYAKDQEIMSNYEYDKLYDELVELEKDVRNPRDGGMRQIPLHALPAGSERSDPRDGDRTLRDRPLRRTSGHGDRVVRRDRDRTGRADEPD